MRNLLPGLLLAVLCLGCEEPPPSPYQNGQRDGGQSDGGPRDGGTSDSGPNSDSGPPDWGVDFDGGVDAEVPDVGRISATGEPRLIVLDLSEGSPLEWRRGYQGAGSTIPINAEHMSNPIPVNTSDVPLSMLRASDELVLFTMMYPAWSNPPLEMVIAFGNIPESAGVTNAVTNTMLHEDASATHTSIKVSNGDAMSRGFDVYLQSSGEPEREFRGVSFGNTTAAALVSRYSSRVRLTYVAGPGDRRTRVWVLPPLAEDRYHLLVMEFGTRAWLVGASVPSVIPLE